MVKGTDETVLLHFIATDQLENFLCLVSPSVVRFYCLVVRDFKFNVNERVFICVRKYFTQSWNQIVTFVGSILFKCVLKDVLL